MLFKVIGVALAACILSSLLDTYSPNIKPPFLIGAAALLVFLLTPAIRQITAQIVELALYSEFLAQPARVLVKCMLISFLTKTAADMCVDCGQKLIAAQIETAGKITVVMLNIPLLVSVVEQLCTMMQI